MLNGKIVFSFYISLKTTGRLWKAFTLWAFDSASDTWKMIVRRSASKRQKLEFNALIVVGAG